MFKFLSRTKREKAVPVPTEKQPSAPAIRPNSEAATTIFQHDVAYGRLRYAIWELEGAIEQLEVTLREIQKGQQQHAQGLQQTLTTVEELSSATEEVAASAQTSATAAQHANNLAQQGRTAINQAHRQMDHIKETVQETGDTVMELGQRAASITDIVDIIQQIASQTNLLSLNAAIEAARAGDAGRGFTVVADEVRKLSEQSAAQARQIAGVVNEIGEEINLVVNRMNESIEAVDAGSIVVMQAREALEAIVDAAGQVNEMVGQISQVTAQQAAGGQQIVQVSSAMAQLTEQVNYTIDKGMMDAAQQRAAWQRLASLTTSLGDISRNLGHEQAADRPQQCYRWCLGGEPLTFDPHLNNDLISTCAIAEIFVGLTRFGSDTQIVPGLAKAWDLSADGRTWTFQLRQGATFHHGREVKASDVKYSLERILRPATGSPNTWLVEMIEGAKAVLAGQATTAAGITTEGDYIIHITLEQPYHPFLANLAYTGTSIVPPEIAEKGQLATHPVGAGPFQFVSYDKGKQIILEAYEEFYGGRPFLDRIEQYVEPPGKKTRLDAFLAREIDHLTLNAQNIDAIQQHPRYAQWIQRQPALRTHHVGINCGKGGPLSNPLVRQALNLAVDKQAMVDELFGGLAQVASGPLPPGCVGYDKTLQPYPFDLAAARAKLSAAGYPQGLPEPLIFHMRAGHATQKRQIAMMQDWFEQIGIKLAVRELPWNELITTAAMRQCDLYLMTWIGDTGDPDNFLQPLFNSRNQGDMGNRTFFADDKVDDLLAQGQAIRDPALRRQHYQKLQRLLHDLAPWIFISHDEQLVVTQPYVRGYHLHPLAMVYLENVWLDKNKTGHS